VNCRTYGVPTEIDGKGQVCGLSRFQTGKTYPTVKLNQIQQVLLDLSRDVSTEMAGRRWPVASILLADSKK